MSYNVFSDTGEQKFINPAGDQQPECQEELFVYSFKVLEY
jgi:hypothetical protein